MKFAIFGAGGHGAAVLGVLKALQHEVECFVDLKSGGHLGGVPVVSEEEFFAGPMAGVSGALGIGNVRPGTLREKIYSRAVAGGIEFPPLVHPRAYVAPTATLGSAVVVFPLAVVHESVDVGVGAIVNTAAVVEHNVKMGDWVHVAPGAVICGGATIGTGSFIGANSTVVHGVIVAAGSMVKAGELIRKNQDL